MPTLALIGLGSNLGDRQAALEGAIAALDETPGVVVQKVSSFHETEPVGGPAGQGNFLNAAAATRDDARSISVTRGPGGDRNPVRPGPNRTVGRAHPGSRLVAVR